MHNSYYNATGVGILDRWSYLYVVSFFCILFSFIVDEDLMVD